MSAPSFSSSPSTAAPALRAVPPYAGPLQPSGELTTMGGRVGPFVPAAHRQGAGWETREGLVASTATITPAVAATAVEMVVPASIPPYRPLRPTPIITPAIRTPLYIPPILTPSGEMVVEDEGIIEPQVIHTAEFAVPTVAIDPPMVDATADDVTAMDAFATPTSPAAEEHVPSDEATGVGGLPWIDAFLASTPVAPLAAVTEAEAAEEMTVEVEAQAEAVGESADEWPLDEAAAEFRALRTAMDEQAAHDTKAAPVGGTDEGLPVAPLPEWSDDDLLDIMPIRHSGKTPLSNAALPADGDLWAERARKAHEEAQVFRAMASAQADERESIEASAADHQAPESTAEEAAHALELLARRVRAGELTLPSYDPRMGEPAALVAALAALLGVKLR